MMPHSNDDFIIMAICNRDYKTMLKQQFYDVYILTLLFSTEITQHIALKWQVCFYSDINHPRLCPQAIYECGNKTFLGPRLYTQTKLHSKATFCGLGMHMWLTTDVVNIQGLGNKPGLNPPLQVSGNETESVLQILSSSLTPRPTFHIPVLG